MYCVLPINTLNGHIIGTSINYHQAISHNVSIIVIGINLAILYFETV